MSKGESYTALSEAGFQCLMANTRKVFDGTVHTSLYVRIGDGRTVLVRDWKVLRGHFVDFYECKKADLDEVLQLE